MSVTTWVSPFTTSIPDNETTGWYVMPLALHGTQALWELRLSFSLFQLKAVMFSEHRHSLLQSVALKHCEFMLPPLNCTLDFYKWLLGGTIFFASSTVLGNFGTFYSWDLNVRFVVLNLWCADFDTRCPFVIPRNSLNFRACAHTCWCDLHHFREIYVSGRGLIKGKADCFQSTSLPIDTLLRRPWLFNMLWNAY